MAINDDGTDAELRAVLDAAYAHHYEGRPAPPPIPPEYSKSELRRNLDDSSAHVESGDLYAFALQILATPWSPPKSLTVEMAKAFLGDEPRPWLTDVVDLLAFGERLPDNIRKLLNLLRSQRDSYSRTRTCGELDSAGYSPLIVTARRQQAAFALFGAARRANAPVFLGSHDRHTDCEIPTSYFDRPRKHGDEAHSIEIDLDRLPDDQFSVESDNQSGSRWFNVRVIDVSWFVDWLASQFEYIESCMLEPMLGAEKAGYVPLCVALHWIVTSGGTQLKRLDDRDAWASAVAELRPFLTDKSFEVIGLPGIVGLPEVIPSSAFALIDIWSPLYTDGFLLSSPSSIDCSSYFDEEHWKKHSNDKLYVTGKQGPHWTHLQVRKADILGRWPRPEGGDVPSIEVLPAEAKNKSHRPKMVPVIEALKRSGIKCKADVGRNYKKLAAEMAPKIKCYGTDANSVNALTTMLKRLTDADFRAK